jgi:predicted AlkP superfamily pyrophosphatase or phosphodiesterase
MPIQHGRFYTQDDYPDLELFHTAAMLVRKYNPDYLLIHPMGMDYLGEHHGADSSKYQQHATRQDIWLAPLILEWLNDGYHLLVTDDHGINADHAHGGTTPDVREVPLFFINPERTGIGNSGQMISQLAIAPTAWSLLGLNIPESMKQLPVRQ